MTQTENCPHELECFDSRECQLRQREAGVPAALKITTPGLTQEITTAELKCNMWVEWRGTQCRIESVYGPVLGGCQVRLSRYNMCGTMIGRVDVNCVELTAWTVVPNPNR